MKTPPRVMVLSLIAAVPIYLWLEGRFPNIAPQELYGIAAFCGFVVGWAANRLWTAVIARRKVS